MKTACPQWLAFIAQEDAIDQLCSVIVDDGASLHSFCKAHEFQYTTAIHWIDEDPDRKAKYAYARDARSDVMFDELDRIADLAIKAKDVVESAGYRLKSDNVKWKLARMSPRKYGDKLQIDQMTTVVNLSEEEILRQRETITKRLAEGAEGPAE